MDDLENIIIDQGNFTQLSEKEAISETLNTMTRALLNTAHNPDLVTSELFIKAIDCSLLYSSNAKAMLFSGRDRINSELVFLKTPTYH